MSKLISEYVYESPAAESPSKMIEIKHTRTMQDASGNDVVVVDHIETRDLNQAISECEAHKARLEADLALCEAELADMIAIRDGQ